MSGVELITAERERQVSEEGWTEEHDDEHTGGAMGMAAACYATPTPLYSMRAKSTLSKGTQVKGEIKYVDPWPWGGKWDKREKHSRIKQLTIAGALCAAEIDRLLRLEKTSE